MVAAYFASKSKSGKKVTGHFEDTVGGVKDAIFGDDGSDARKKEYNRQKEFAQMGIQWKVADARAAGIHPLFALGAQTTGYNPQHISGDSGFLQGMGQNVARAAMSGMTKTERAYTRAVQTLTLDRMHLENEILKSQKTKIDQDLNPPQPDPTRPGFDPTFQDDYTHVETKDGGYAVVPSEKVKQLIEDMPLQEAQWFLRNAAQRHPPKEPAGKGFAWEYNPVTSHWKRVKTGTLSRNFKVWGKSMLDRYF